jgi:hypothetical protein
VVVVVVVVMMMKAMMMMMMTTLMTRTLKHNRIGRKLSCLVPVGSCFMTVRLIILPEV